MIDEDAWKPFEDPAAIGFLFDFRPKSWPVNIAVDYLSAGDYKYQDSAGSIIRIEGKTRELCIGVRKLFELTKTMRPYVGGGLAHIRGKFTNISSDDDSGAGFWVNTGFYYAFANHLNIGIDLRYSRAEISLFGKDVDAGGFSAGLTAGFHW